ncbi:hypothetical protein QQ045_008840 [Rhodiola kirilowii]
MRSQIMANGGYLFQDSTPFPKYKRRKISAVREFPYGCGPNAPRVNGRHMKRSDFGHGDQKSTNEIAVESKVDIHNVVAHEIPPPMDFELVKSANEVSYDSSIEGATSSVAFHVPLQPKESTVNLGSSLNSLGRKYPPRRKVSAVRDFPRCCGIDAPRVTRDECIYARDLSKHGSASNVNDEKGVKHSSLERGENSKADGNAKCNEKHLSAVNLSGTWQGGCQSNDVNVKETVLHVTSSPCLVNTDKNSFETLSESVRLHRDEISQMAESESEMKTVVSHLKLDGEIVVHSEGSGSRGQHLIASESSAKKVDVLNAGPHCKDIVVYIEDKHSGSKRSRSPENAVDRMVVYALMAAPNCPWRQSNEVNLISQSGIRKSGGLTHRFSSGMKKSKVKKLLDERRALMVVSNRNKACANYIEATPLRSSHSYATTMEGDELDSWEQDEGGKNFHVSNNTLDIDLPPVIPNNAKMLKDSNDHVSCSKVRETLRIFHAVFRKLMHKEEANLRRGLTPSKRIDLDTANILKNQGKYINTGQIVGSVPGVDVGLEFQFRVELAMVGLHRPFQAGIDYKKQSGTLIATSIVASGGYADDMISSDVLIYSGSGGNPTKGDKKAEDQKLERGNLALKNSIAAKNPVRVIRGHDHKASGGRARTVKTYTYDGLYLVTKYWQEPGPNGNLVYKFRLERIPGQPELAWNMIKNSKRSNIRHGVCVQDISEGKELVPICAVNTIDDEKPPSFKYITSMLYPEWCRPLPLRGCNCVAECSDSASCSCAVRNHGEIPFNNNGSIVEVKPLVYECGPSCKCPPSCSNRVSQLGIRFQLEIFKTESRGWGVRSLNYIPSGSFICEYLGELLEDKEAEQRIGSDEYLFDIGSNFSDQNLLDEFSEIMPHPQIGSSEVVDDVGFTIDAERYGNVGRFINHSCSPNLYAQNVLYDHEDSRMPHIMLFAAENIPPLQELTYHYNYNIGQVRDAIGNVKIKHCFCGSADCAGRLY